MESSQEGGTMKLQTSFDGLVLQNPLMPASGPLVGDAEKLLFLQNAGCGALVTKTISVQLPVIPKPCIYGAKDYVMNSELWSEHPYTMWVEEFLPKMLRFKDRPLIVSVGYSKEDMEVLIPLLDPFADAFEVSTHYVGTNLDVISAIVKTIRTHTKKPIYMKISPHIPSPEAFAHAIQDAGANGIVAINSLGPTMHIDVLSRQIQYSNQSGYVWMSGPAIKPIALATIYKIKQAVPSLTVIGVGGIQSAEDVIEFLLAGASAVQMLSAALLKGKGLYQKIIDQLPKTLEKFGFDSIEQVKNTVLHNPFEFKGVVPTLKEDQCIQCMLCKEVCPYHAITFNDIITIDEQRCFRCGLCVSKCPTKALVGSYSEGRL
jgi:dihydroorotate dehydrogenase subfamily 1